MALNLKHQTLAQFAARLRERYKQSKGEGCANIARFILRGLENGDFTDTQVRNAFGMTVIQYTAFKTKLTTLRNNWQAIQEAVGE